MLRSARLRRDPGPPPPDAHAVAAGHDTRLLSHGARRPRSVLLLHGYTHSPAQLDGLAERFFARGYNVLVPRAPGHGLTDPDAHATVTAPALLGYATAALDRIAELGEETGVVGVSAGAVLATWLAALRPGVVRRLLVLAPLFAPHPGQVPAAVRVPLQVLYGLRALPDRRNARGYSYRAVAQYLRIVASYPSVFPADGVRHVAAVLSPGDTTVDPRAAFDLPARLARSAGATLRLDTLPAGLGLAHDIISAHRLGPHAPVLNERYVELYEDTYR
ncbi:alpha/beta fold hydrolase [Dactylosporangium sp. NPDC051485]|uniref:alpha/beta hydrolase n=1 Tax=Dactylosporangium sp. NPDC051485 TaxID=3154846 RepID=UPI00341519FF